MTLSSRCWPSEPLYNSTQALNLLRLSVLAICSVSVFAGSERDTQASYPSRDRAVDEEDRESRNALPKFDTSALPTDTLAPPEAFTVRSLSSPNPASQFEAPELEKFEALLKAGEQAASVQLDRNHQPLGSKRQAAIANIRTLRETRQGLASLAHHLQEIAQQQQLLAAHITVAPTADSNAPISLSTAPANERQSRSQSDLTSPSPDAILKDAAEATTKVWPFDRLLADLASIPRSSRALGAAKPWGNPGISVSPTPHAAISNPTHAIAKPECWSAATGKRCMPYSGRELGAASPDRPLAASDIRGHWAEVSLRSLARAGIMVGFADGQFKPDAPISRSQFAAMLARAFPAAQTGAMTHSVTDVDADALLDRSALLTLFQQRLQAQPSAQIEGGIDVKAWEQSTRLRGWQQTQRDRTEQALRSSPVTSTTSTFGPQPPATRADAAVLLHQALILQAHQRHHKLAGHRSNLRP